MFQNGLQIYENAMVSITMEWSVVYMLATLRLNFNVTSRGMDGAKS